MYPQNIKYRQNQQASGCSLVQLMFWDPLILIDIVPLKMRFPQLKNIDTPNKSLILGR